METTPELIIFLIIGTVAIVAAVMMLVSENAVHSALFLILNFACVAFFYLMLNAAFLAMVQITVYAGAIMVLFMFVIMLLGAEKLAPESSPRFPWLTPAAVILTIIFLITAGVGILEAEVSTSQPEPIQPMVRVVNAASGLETVEVSLNGEPITEEAVDFQESSDLVEREAGAYTITVSVNGEAVAVSLLHINDPMADLSLYEQLGQRLENGSIPAATLEYLEPAINLENDTDITLLLTALPDGGYGIIPVTQNLNAVEHDKIGNIQLVNAMPGINAVDLADITEADRAPRMVVENVQFGEFSEIASRRAEHEDYAVYPAGLIRNAAAENEDFKVRDVEAIAHLQEEDFTANTSALFVIAPALRSSIAGQEPELMQFVTVNRPRFGSPTSIGQLLYTGYMLPFQVIALLLLVAMIGAIVLTRDQVAPPRKRFQRRLANVSSNPLVGED